MINYRWSCGNESEWWLNHTDKDYKEYGGIIERKIIKIDKCRGVDLYEGSEIKKVLVSQEDIKLYELIENFRRADGNGIDRIKKYIDMYIIYETYAGNEDTELKAIHHSFSHSRDKLTHKQTVDTLMRLFGDVKIDFQKLKHRKIFQDKFKILKQECELLLLAELKKRLTKQPNFLDVYYKV